MAETPNLKLPLISGNMTADVPRDMNALAEAIDANVTEALTEVTVPDATLTTKGVVKYSSAMNSDSETEAATPKAVHDVTKYADTQIAVATAEAVQDVDQTIQGLEREVANLNLQLTASQRVPNGVTFGSNFADSFGMTIDTTKTATTAALSAGATSIPVESVTGLTAGMEVTIYDDVNIERVKITSINGNTLTVPAVTKAYKVKASVARTSAVIDTANKCLKFGGWKTRADYYTSGGEVLTTSQGIGAVGGGRKICKLSNGAGFMAAYSSGLRIYLYKFDVGTLTWSLFSSMDWTSTIADFSIAPDPWGGVYLLSCNTNGVADLKWFKSDGTLGFTKQPSANETFSQNTRCEVVTDLVNNAFYMVIEGILQTSGNSKNIVFSAAGITETTGITWWKQNIVLTTDNSAGWNNTYPHLAVNEDNFQCMVVWSRAEGSTANRVMCRVYDGPTLKFLGSSAYAAYSYSSATPVLEVTCFHEPKAFNGFTNGIWHIEYAALVATSIYGIYHIESTSSDGSVWNTPPTYISNDSARTQRGPISSMDHLGNLYVTWMSMGTSGKYEIAMRVKDKASNTWGGNFRTAQDASNDLEWPSSMGQVAEFASIPPTIFLKLSVSIQYMGQFIANTEVPLLENDVRFTIKDTDEAVAWTLRDPGLYVTGALNGQTMTKTTAGNEDQFVKALDAIGPAEIRLTMKRIGSLDDVKITRILGGTS